MCRCVLVILLFVLTVCGCAATSSSLSLEAIGFTNVQRTSRLNFDVEYLPLDTMAANDMISRANAARSALNRETGDALQARVRIVIAPNRQAFLRMVGGWAENSAAVAVPRRRIMIINGDVMRTGPPGNLGTILVHELAHLYFGVHAPQSLPRWLDEGLAQAIANEGSAESIGSLVWAKWLGSLFHLSDLEQSFPVEGNRQRLAYHQSLSLVRHIVMEDYGNSLEAFIHALTGKQADVVIANFWDPVSRDLLELRWRKSLSAGGNWLTLTLSSGIFWGVTAVLTLLAWMLIRHRRRILRTEWDEEEKIYEALDEEEERLYGEQDEEDRIYRDEHEWGSYDESEGDDHRQLR